MSQAPRAAASTQQALTQQISTKPFVDAQSTPKQTSNPNVNPEYEPDFEDIELTNMRKVIAKRLVLSKTTIPHSYINTTCVIDKVVALRKEMIANGQKVSLNDFIIKAAGLTLKVNFFVLVNFQKLNLKCQHFS